MDDYREEMGRFLALMREELLAEGLETLRLPDLEDALGRLLPQIDSAALEEVWKMNAADRLLLAAFWINYINHWSMEDETFDISLAIAPLFDSLLDRLEDKNPNLPEDRAEMFHLMLNTMLGDLEVYPWSREWLYKSSIDAIRWLPNEDDWLSFALFEQERIAQEDETVARFASLLQNVKYEGTAEQQLSFYRETWLLRHGFGDRVRAFIASEDEAEADLRLVNEVRSLDAIEDETEPDEAALAAIEAASLDGDSVLDTDALHAETDGVTEAELDRFYRDEEEDLHALTDQVYTNPYLLRGRFPSSLREGLAAYSLPHLQYIAENIGEDEEMIRDADQEMLVDLLTDRIPARLRVDLQLGDGALVRLLEHLSEPNGSLASYDRALMINELVEKGYIFLILRPSGYRIYVPTELLDVIAERGAKTWEADAKFFTLIREVATGLVNWRGAVQLDALIDVLSESFHEEIKGQSLGELRRMVRTNLELYETYVGANFRYERPYIYHAVIDRETAVVVYEIAETGQTKMKPLGLEDLRASQIVPFTRDTAAWLAFLNQMGDTLEGYSWEEHQDILAYLAIVSAQDMPLDYMLELFAEFGLDLEDSHYMEAVLRAYSEFANSCPLWHMGGYSRKELGVEQSYEDRMASAMQKLEEHAGHDHHHHDHHYHDHHHHDHEHCDHDHHHHH